MKQLEWFVTGIVILALAVVGTLYLTSGPPPEQVRRAERNQIISTGIRAMLDDMSGLEIVTLVPGIQTGPNTWDFRGNASVDGRWEPFYGVAELVCDRVQSNANCWRVLEMERDGRSVMGREAVTPLQSQSGYGKADRDSRADAPAGTRLRTQDAPVRDAAPTVESETTAAAPAEAPQTLWRVTGATVNGRAGPGTSFPIIARLGQEHRLRRIGLDDGWGQYEIVQPVAEAGQELWVWADLVSEAP